MKIEKATEKHLKDIKDIMNYSIINSNFNFNFKPKTDLEIEEWYFEHINNNYPIIVCIINDEVVGWASLSSFRSYQAYDKTAEVSVYVKNEHQKKGIGLYLLNQIENQTNKFHSIVSVITAGNKASINLHKKVGYEYKCTFQEIGYKNNEFLDVVFLHKILNLRKNL